MTEWIRLKGGPYDEELQLTRVSGNVSEFETRLGYRYRCVRENGAKQWFSFRKNHHMKGATRAEVKICCKKLQSSFGTFVDRPNGNGLVRIFPQEQRPHWPTFEPAQLLSDGVEKKSSFCNLRKQKAPGPALRRAGFKIERASGQPLDPGKPQPAAILRACSRT